MQKINEDLKAFNTKYPFTAAGVVMPAFGTGSVLRTAIFPHSDASCEKFLLNVPGSLLVQCWECCHCHSDFH